MTDEQLNGLYEVIRTYYNFYTPRIMFLEVYRKEFKGLPFKLLETTVSQYCADSRNNNPPTISDIKNRLLRIKWIMQGKLYDDKRRPYMNDQTRQGYIDKLRLLEKVLGEYGEEYHDDIDFWQDYEATEPVQEISCTQIDAVSRLILSMNV